jgi:dihydroorotate dehydrogenase (NAD+) catalytic subunit
MESPRTPADLLGVRLGPSLFPNPVFLASGICGYGEEYAPVIPVERLGGLVTKTVTPRPRPGNPPPRLHETGSGLLNSIGLENVGIDAFLAEKLPRAVGKGLRVIVSLSAESLDAFGGLARKVARSGGYSGVELNLSCPNVDRGLEFGQDPSLVEAACRTVRGELPPEAALVAKLTPNVASMGEMARAAERGGADAVSGINTFTGMDVDLETGRPVFARGTGGYSGPAIFPLALARVHEMARSTSIPVMGIGGISSVEDVKKMLLAGASCVQLGTAIYANPALAGEVLDALEGDPAFMERAARAGGEGARAR